MPHLVAVLYQETTTIKGAKVTARYGGRFSIGQAVALPGDGVS